MVVLVALILVSCASEITRDGDFATIYCIGACAMTSSAGATEHIIRSDKGEDNNKDINDLTKLNDK